LRCVIPFTTALDALLALLAPLFNPILATVFSPFDSILPTTFPAILPLFDPIFASIFPAVLPPFDYGVTTTASPGIAPTRPLSVPWATPIVPVPIRVDRIPYNWNSRSGTIFEQGNIAALIAIRDVCRGYPAAIITPGCVAPLMLRHTTVHSDRSAARDHFNHRKFR
jgi:hypothetical protein